MTTKKSVPKFHYQPVNIFIGLMHVSLFLILGLTPYAQVPLKMPKVPLIRELPHLNIDHAQQDILNLSKKNDTVFNASKDESVNYQITQILIGEINNMQASIELDSMMSGNEKYKYLRGIEALLKDFINAYNYKLIKKVYLGDLIYCYKACIALDQKHQSIFPLLTNTELEIGNIIVLNDALKTNVGIKASKDLMVLKLCQKYPNKILKILSNQPDMTFADSLITIYAHNNQEELYNYAAANDKLGKRIQKNQDPLVKMIARLAKMDEGRLYFPFLDKLYKNELTLTQVANALKSDNSYFKLLVKTEIEYAKRIQNGDTPYVHHGLVGKLRDKALEFYINDINGMHEETNDAIRFQPIDSLSPKELYFLCVLGEDEIYTSSYLGVYKRIFERLKIPRGDTLLNLVNGDFYKKFIKVAAAYNTLGDFLKRMDKKESDELMRHFVSDLTNSNTLEDAVDVANSFGSINDLGLKEIISEQIRANLKSALKSGTKREQTIYGILSTLFLTRDSSVNSDITEKLGIPGVFIMPSVNLLDTIDRKIYMQQFFYGDKDGKGVFQSFLTQYKNPNWKITQYPEWVEVRSVKDVQQVVIYANKPLDEAEDLDAKAQLHLGKFLDSLQIYPAIVVHRGHSYYLNSTIQQISRYSKLVLLGSCGGYQSLNTVLELCPAAQVISSKQVGTGAINEALINAIADSLRMGKDLNWPSIWKELEGKFVGVNKERFDDYVPPYKNLGAMFIKAYNKEMDEEQ